MNDTTTSQDDSRVLELLLTINSIRGAALVVIAGARVVGWAKKKERTQINVSKSLLRLFLN